MPAHRCIFRRLLDDTIDPHRDLAARPRVAGWAEAEPTLAGCETPADLVARCVDRDDRRAANLALGALIRLGVDDLFARKMAFAALTPGLASLAHRVAARWAADIVEVDQVAAFVAWELLAGGHVDESGPARWLLGRVEGRLRWALVSDHRHPPVELRAADRADAGPDKFEVAAGRLDAARHVRRTVAAGRLSALGARVVWETRVEDRPVADVAGTLGRTSGSVRVLRARAERALRAAG